MSGAEPSPNGTADPSSCVGCDGVAAFTPVQQVTEPSAPP